MFSAESGRSIHCRWVVELPTFHCQSLDFPQKRDSFGPNGGPTNLGLGWAPPLPILPTRGPRKSVEERNLLLRASCERTIANGKTEGLGDMKKNFSVGISRKLCLGCQLSLGFKMFKLTIGVFLVHCEASSNLQMRNNYHLMMKGIHTPLSLNAIRQYLGQSGNLVFWMPIVAHSRRGWESTG